MASKLPIKLNHIVATRYRKRGKAWGLEYAGRDDQAGKWYLAVCLSEDDAHVGANSGYPKFLIYKEIREEWAMSESPEHALLMEEARRRIWLVFDAQIGLMDPVATPEEVWVDPGEGE